MTNNTPTVEQCPKGSCQRHGKCMYLKHPQCPLTFRPTDTPTVRDDELVEQRARELARENEIPPWFMLPNYIKADYRAKARKALDDTRHDK